MANANPTGHTLAHAPVRPEVNLPAGTYLVRTKENTVVRRTYMENGNVVESAVFEADFDKKQILTEAAVEKLVKANAAPEPNPEQGKEQK